MEISLRGCWRTPCVPSLGIKHLRKLSLPAFFDEVAQWQHERGVHGDLAAWMLENPFAFKASESSTYAGKGFHDGRLCGGN